MRVHIVRHVSFEGPALIAEWAHARGHEMTESLAPAGEYPPVDEVDLLVLMGGPMDADDEGANPWLVAEKRYLAEAIAAGVAVLGVCLGAQIIAEVAGGTVRRGAEREIGWFPVSLTDAGRADPAFAAFQEDAVVGHWHGDTFDLPPGVGPALSSELTPNQAFSLANGRVVGLQFHLEWTPDSLRLLVDACADELEGGGRFVHSADELLAPAAERSSACSETLFSLLDRLVERRGQIA